MKNNPNEFYTEFDDNDSESNEPIPQEQKQNKDLAFIQTKKELFLTALLTLPFSASIGSKPLRRKLITTKLRILSSSSRTSIFFMTETSLKYYVNESDAYFL